MTITVPVTVGTWGDPGPPLPDERTRDMRFIDTWQNRRYRLFGLSIGMIPVTPRLPGCRRYLTVPNHKHTSNACYAGDHTAYGPGPTFDLDHPRWFRRTDGSQWALLSQDYAAAPQVSAHVECDHIITFAAAPYGFGTTGTLYVGFRR